MAQYIARMIIRETAKAYLVEVKVNNRRDGCFRKEQWVAKSLCKPCEDEGAKALEQLIGERYVMVPEYVIGNGTW